MVGRRQGFGTEFEEGGSLSERAIERIAPLVDMILDCVHREYPNHLLHSLGSDADLLPPRELHPAFFGSFDWHSSVHSHWSLARASRVLPAGERRDRCRGALEHSLSREKISGELDYFHDRPGFECPYGVAWLLLLQTELEDLGATREAEALAPLAETCERSLLAYLARLTHPVRSGQHDQSAFALGLILDAARRRGRDECAAAVVATARRLYSEDRDAPMRFEPSNHDFLSPALAEADLMRRVLREGEFSSWLTEFLPGIPTDDSSAWLAPIGCSDPSDGRLSHRIGLDLSRAWMLEGIALALGNLALGERDPRAESLRGVAEIHREAGLSAIDPQHYSGSHWLGTFGVYLLSGGSTPGGWVTRAT
jgi:hypothetical protein